MTNLYRVLGVSPSATPEQVKAAYRKLAQAHHPDKNGGEDAQFKEISAAYEILGDAARRAEYARQRQAWLTEQGAVECPGCGQALRPGARQKRGVLQCGKCGTQFPTAQADEPSPAAPESSRSRPPDVVQVVATRLREHGQRIGNQVIVEAAVAAEQLTDEMVAQAASVAAEGLRAGFARIRTRLGLTRRSEASGAASRASSTKLTRPRE